MRAFSSLAAVCLVGLLCAGPAGANGGPFLVKHPDGDPAAKGVLTQIDPDLMPGRESRLRVVGEDLSVLFGCSSGWDQNEPPLAQVRATYTIENPTNERVEVDFGFPILRGIYFYYYMDLVPAIQVEQDGREVYERLDVLTNSAIYGVIRARARETIDKAIAADPELARLAAAVKATAERKAPAAEARPPREVLASYLTGRRHWNARDAALMVEYPALKLDGEGRFGEPARDGNWLLLWRESNARLVNANLGILRAIGEQKATQYFAQLASRFDANAAATYERIFAAWGGDVRERSVDLGTGRVRPRELTLRPAALESASIRQGSDPTVYARVDYLQRDYQTTDAEADVCRAILKNLPVVFTFAPMSLLHYRVSFNPHATQKLSISYSQYAYADTRRPATYQLAYVVHPASFWEHFGPIRLEVAVPQGVRFRASVPTRPAGTEEREVKDPLDRRRQGAAMWWKGPFDIHRAVLDTPEQKKGELFLALDGGACDVALFRMLEGKPAGNSGQALIHAAPRGQTALAKYLLEHGAKTSAGDAQGHTPLHLAACAGDREMVELLLAHGADVNAGDKGGFSPLLYAAIAGKSDVAKLLVRKGADPNRKCHGNENILMDYAISPSWVHTETNGVSSLSGSFVTPVEAVRVLLDAGADPNVPGAEGRTALGVAALLGRQDVVRLLLDRGADPNAAGAKGQTALHAAAEGGHVEIAEALLAKGARVNAADADGRTPLHVASWRHDDMVKCLLRKGAHADARTKDGRTPLHSGSLSVDSVRALLDAGAPVNAVDKEGRTPLHEIASGPKESVALLLARGAKITAKDRDGQTPIFEAARAYTAGPVEALIAAGADPRARDKEGFTPLHVSAAFGRKDAAAALLAHGVDANARSDAGFTPLLLAFRSGWADEKLQALLIEKGADINVKGPEGMTPLHAAAWGNCPEGARLLLAAGAKKDARDDKGKTPLDIAVAEHNPRVEQALR